MKITTFLLVAVAWLLSNSAVAQSGTSTNAGSATSASPTAGQLRAAEDLLNTVYTEESFNQLIDKMVAAQVKLHPNLERLQPEMLSFMHKYMSLSAIRPEIAIMYAQEFTEAELVEITRFYQSPVGKKAASKLPTIMQNSMVLGQRHVQEHLPELEKIFREKLAEPEPTTH